MKEGEQLCEAMKNSNSDKVRALIEAGANFDQDYLEDRVSFSEDKLMDSNSKVVIMAWEKPLMEAHAKATCSGGGHILNIGFGMGLV